MPVRQRDYALIGHLDSFEKYRWLFTRLREEGKTEELEGISDELLASYLRGMPPSRAAEILPAKGKVGDPVTGCYIECYFNPEELDDAGARNRAMRKVEKACQVAARLGVKVASLGGFTSILGELSRD